MLANIPAFSREAMAEKRRNIEEQKHNHKRKPTIQLQQENERLSGLEAMRLQILERAKKLHKDFKAFSSPSKAARSKDSDGKLLKPQD